MTSLALEKKNWPWISAVEAMEKLNVTSPSTLQRLRDEGAICFTQPRKKIMLCAIESICEYLEKNAKDTFRP